jgi:hypothetical protein
MINRLATYAKEKVASVEGSQEVFSRAGKYIKKDIYEPIVSSAMHNIEDDDEEEITAVLNEENRSLKTLVGKMQAEIDTMKKESKLNNEEKKQF